VIEMHQKGERADMSWKKKLMLVFVVTPLTIIIMVAVFKDFIDSGLFMQIWGNLMSDIPFGHWLGSLAITIYSDVFGLAGDVAKYTIGQPQMNLAVLWEDICRVVLVAICHEAVKNAFRVFLGLNNKEGFTKILLEIACVFLSIVTSTVAATAVTAFLFAQLAGVSGFVQGIIGFFVSILTVAGAFGVVWFALGTTIINTVIVAGLKVVMLNVVKVLTTYISLFLIVVYINEEAYLAALATFGGWGVVIIVMTAISIMIDGIKFEKRI